MLPTKYRLKEKKEFNRLFRQGKTIYNDVLLIKYGKASAAEPKIGFSVGIKFSKKASRRNKVKRWMREAARTQINNIQPGTAVIFLINSKFPYEQINLGLINEKMKDLLGKAKLLK